MSHMIIWILAVILFYNTAVQYEKNLKLLKQENVLLYSECIRAEDPEYDSLQFLTEFGNTKIIKFNLPKIKHGLLIKMLSSSVNKDIRPTYSSDTDLFSDDNTLALFLVIPFGCDNDIDYSPGTFPEEPPSNCASIYLRTIDNQVISFDQLKLDENQNVFVIWKWLKNIFSDDPSDPIPEAMDDPILYN